MSSPYHGIFLSRLLRQVINKYEELSHIPVEKITFQKHKAHNYWAFLQVFFFMVPSLTKSWQIDTMTSHIKINDFSSKPHAFLSNDGGVSKGIYESLNCGSGSDDDADLVLENRRIAANIIGGRRDTPLVSCYQIHSDIAVNVTSNWASERPKADAMATNRPGIILGILTADCTPVLFADEKAGVVGAAHAGWKGAHAGVIESTVSLMETLGADRHNINAAIGPTIAQSSYEVGTDFHDQFLSLDSAFEKFFIPGKDSAHHQFDLPAFVTHQLDATGIGAVFNCGVDTYTSQSHFSYRRTTHRKEADYGRQVSGIMLSG